MKEGGGDMGKVLQEYRGTGSRRHVMQWLPALMAAGLLLLGRAAHASEAVALPPFGSQENTIIGIAFAAGVLSLVFGYYWYHKIKAQSPGTERMEEVGKAIRDGALAYLRQQVKAMAVLVIIVAIGLFALYSAQAS